MNSYEKLAGAIVMTAVRDWRTAVEKLRKRPDHELSVWLKNDSEKFFLSAWFETLTGADGEVILNRLKQEACKDDK